VKGTLLTNVTWFAGQLALRDCPRELRRLHQHAGDVSPIVTNYDFAALKINRVIEEATLAKGRSVQLRTDLVPFPHPPADSSADNHLLIYSSRSKRSARLITVFPVVQAVAEQWLAPENQGDMTRKGLPYNAYVRGLSGRSFQVRRRIVRDGID
jgi:hypothetical protein